MGTTAVAALVRGGTAHLCHVGDSRCYLLRGGRLVQLTHDHSYVQ
jgi:protein phosphatase